LAYGGTVSERQSQASGASIKVSTKSGQRRPQVHVQGQDVSNGVADGQRSSQPIKCGQVKLRKLLNQAQT